MKQQTFENHYSALWTEIESHIAASKDKNASYLSAIDFPEKYRHLCHHLTLAKQRRYSPQLISHLNELVIRAHHHFYQVNQRFHMRWLHFIVWGFPNAIRQNARFVWLAIALFCIPLLGMGLACFQNDEFIYTISNPVDVASYEAMYDPSKNKLGRERDSQTDVYMFGFYIRNNIGVSFRTFASGIVFGLGSIFFLAFNGFSIGGIAGHLTQLGYTTTFYPFVVGHGAFELTAIVFSGAAGLMLGYSLINPGRLSRLDALRKSGKQAVLIMYGTTLMLIIAAFLEAFWSSSASLPIMVKYSVGGFFWLLVIAYFVFSGRKMGLDSSGSE